MREQLDPDSPATALAPPASAAPWSLARTLLFRFALLYAAVYIFPFPFYNIPGLDAPSAWLAERQARLVHAVGVQLFQLPAVLPSVGGCGDRADQFVGVPVEALVAVAGTLVWSALDRRRASYRRLAYWASACLRYYLAHTLLQYGVIKLFKSQFQVPGPTQLLSPLGELTPMNVLWAFMGISTGYTFFIGLAEATGALLLLSRRTALAGAVLCFAVLTNVFLLNVFYGVCVKLLSAHLLLFAGLLLVPHTRRIVDVFLLGRPVPRLDVGRPSYGPTAVRAFVIIKLVVVWAIVSTVLDYGYEAWHRYGDAAPKPAFHGIWDVETFERNGANAAAEPSAWRWLAIESGPYASVRPQVGKTRAIGLRFDTGAHTVQVQLDPNDDATLSVPYTTPKPDVLELDVPIEGATTHVRLKQRTRIPLITSRFRWTSDLP